MTAAFPTVLILRSRASGVSKDIPEGAEASFKTQLSAASQDEGSVEPRHQSEGA